MKLQRQDQEFRNPKVFYPDAKSIDLDRVLINLFMLLRCEGTRPATRGRPPVAIEKIEHHFEQLASMPGVRGFREHPDIAKAWLESDVFDLVNRGTAREAVASLRPLHLDAHKIRVAKHCRDYNVADALYAMLAFGEAQALEELKRYLDRGRDSATNRYDGKTRLDLETLAVLKLVEGLPNLHPSGEKVAPFPPTCIGQSRILCDDVQRILAYQDEVPRPVMIDYLKTISGLHVALYTLRLTRQLTGWLSLRDSQPTCRSCPVYGSDRDPFAECPYQQSFVVDMGTDFRTRMAQLAQESATREYGRLADLVKAMFHINHLLSFARENADAGVPEDPFVVPRLLDSPTPQFEAYFKVRLQQVRRENEAQDESLTAEEQAILLSGLPPFDTFVELVTHARQRHHLPYLTKMMDRLLQKNLDAGALVQGRSRSNPRRWHIGGRLLEVLVQLAVLRWKSADGRKLFYSQPMLIDDFVDWLEARYGFVLGVSNRPSATGVVTLEQHRAFGANIRLLKDRLREIGFYDDLSDAYNAQTIRPRYPLDQRQG